ncbi:RagB/SusD family nutrient uptake outer membrane protein [Foetidibacter luteolus]|uniref:RagB/SusD family nutrient uptake outer membrane protein n=1 Tax=Foetidibacter luteolus TaxID=2608880 RepID=UPI00129AA876|nr:RagB/SusD family nutrient uptake outer membrane protein [Foetidibacter luteolus]
MFYKLLPGMTILALLLCCSCKKYLAAKSDQRLSTPSSLQDLRTLLDNYGDLNVAMSASNAAADEYFMLDADWSGYNELGKNSYIWHPATQNNSDWVIAYRAVFIANTVLDQLQTIPASDNRDLWNELKGAALFFRAHHFFQLAQIFAMPYQKGSALNGPGIPLRLSSDFNQPTQRADLDQTYERIQTDLREALLLLPSTPIHATRPGKGAAYGMLSRVALITGDYELAGRYADSGLNLSSDLMDYNTLDAGVSAPVPRFNEEVIFYTNTSAPVNATSRAKTDSNLYKSYQDDDLRKVVFFADNGDGTYRFKGSYNNSRTSLFNGIATDELYLTRAECYARRDNGVAAIEQLNKLLIKRWKRGRFVPLTASGSAEALALVLRERKKELVYRGTRWWDIRRFSLEPAEAMTLIRLIEGQEYVLPPGDRRYAFLIPEDVVNLTGIEQNAR